MERIEVQWCTRCGARYTEEEVLNVEACPKCGDTGVPCSTDYDFLIAVNWHELRILGIWASNFAGDKLKDDVGATKALRGILSRLERQAPALPPLTLGGELRQLRQAYPGQVTTAGAPIPAEGVVEVNGPGAVGYAKQLQEPKTPTVKYSKSVRDMAVEILLQEAKSAREYDPDVGISGNEELASLFEGLASSVEENLLPSN